MKGTFRWALQRDLTIALRRRADTLNLLGFFVLACLMVPFAVGPETEWLARLGPGLIWVMALLGAAMVAAVWGGPYLVALALRTSLE